MAGIPVALQLYTVRDHTAKDFLGTLKQVAAMGYAGVEFAGYGGLEAQELRKALDDLGLKAVSTHIDLGSLDRELNAKIDYNLAIGNHYIAVPWLPVELRGDGAGWVDLGVRLNSIGAQCKRQGIQLCYHNHDFEFAQFDGRYGLDLLYGASGPDLLKAEMDIYWVKRAGEDPAGYLQKYAGRCPLLHLKDMESGPDKFFAEVGSGVLDLDSVFAVAPQIGVEWYIVEQDQSRRDSLESARMSISYLQSRGLA